MSKKVYLSKEVKSAIANAMNKSQRKWWKDGELFSIRIYRTGNSLKRWGNYVAFTCNGKGRVTRCNLEEFSGANLDGCIRAIDYFVYGDESEFSVVIM